MSDTTTNTTNISQIIIDTINNLLNTLFSSVDISVYDTLHEISFIDTSFLDDSFFTKLLGSDSSKSLIIIANSLLVAVCIYYSFKLIYSHFTGTQVEKPYQFVFKLLLFGIFINFSHYICEFFIYFTHLISAAITQIGQNLLGEEISFSSLINNLNSVITSEASTINIFSFDGLLKSLISVCFISLLFSYSLRYIMIGVLVLLTPFAFITLITTSGSWFFKSWLKIFLSLLFVQPFISIILLIVFSLDFNSIDVVSKILCIGSIFALIKANTYVQHFIGGVSTDVSQNLRLLRSRIRF